MLPPGDGDGDRVGCPGFNSAPCPQQGPQSQVLELLNEVEAPASAPLCPFSASDLGVSFLDFRRT